MNKHTEYILDFMLDVEPITASLLPAGIGLTGEDVNKIDRWYSDNELITFDLTRAEARALFIYIVENETFKITIHDLNCMNVTYKTKKGDVK